MNEENVSDNQQTMRNMTMADYGDERLNKSNELNSDMSIASTSQDEMTSKLFGGLN